MTIDPQDPLGGFKPPARVTITARAAALMGWTDGELAALLGIARSTAQLWRTHADYLERDQVAHLAQEVATRIGDLKKLLDALARTGA